MLYFVCHKNPTVSLCGFMRTRIMCHYWANHGKLGNCDIFAVGVNLVLLKI